MPTIKKTPTKAEDIRDYLMEIYQTRENEFFSVRYIKNGTTSRDQLINKLDLETINTLSEELMEMFKKGYHSQLHFPFS
jgi:hypothetical protein